MPIDTGRDFLVSVVALNGGRLVGRTRLQKTAFILKKLGAKVPFEFDYHYYGPFSQELSETIQAAVETGALIEETRQGYNDTPYSVFSAKADLAEKIAGVPEKTMTSWLRAMDQYTGTHLELAATILYLRDDIGVPKDHLEDEVQILKPVKATDDKLQRAWDLLSDLGLSKKPAQRAAHH